MRWRMCVRCEDSVSGSGPGCLFDGPRGALCARAVVFVAVLRGATRDGCGSWRWFRGTTVLFGGKTPRCCRCGVRGCGIWGCGVWGCGVWGCGVWGCGIWGCGVWGCVEWGGGVWGCGVWGCGVWGVVVVRGAVLWCVGPCACPTVGAVPMSCMCCGCAQYPVTAHNTAQQHARPDETIRNDHAITQDSTWHPTTTHDHGQNLTNSHVTTQLHT